MRTTWAVRIAAAMAAAVMMVGCSKGSKSSAGQRQDLGGSNYQLVSLKGCVEEAPGTNEYVLRQVQIDPVSMQRSDAPSSLGLTVTDGSSVRLHDKSDQLKAHLGQQVSVSGTIIDNGRNTIGTTGKATEPIGRVSPSNGNVPEMAVERVTATGKSCGNASPKPMDR